MQLQIKKIKVYLNFSSARDRKKELSPVIDHAFFTINGY